MSISSPFKHKLTVRDERGNNTPFLIEEFTDRLIFYKFYKYKEATVSLVTMSCNCVYSKVSKKECIHCSIAKELGLNKVSEGAFNIEI